MRLISGLTLMLLFTAYAPFASPTPTDSGIEGRVLIGPVCPVVIQGQECPNQPFQAFLTILKLNGRVVTRFETDLQGHFRIPLAPGEYTLRHESPNGMIYAGEQNFTVLSGQFTQIIVNYESGIR